MYTGGVKIAVVADLDADHRHSLRLRRCVESIFSSTLAVVALAVAACGSDPGAPEDRVRAVVARAEAAARDRELGTVKAFVSEHYADAQGRTKRDVDQVLAFHFLRNQRIHLLTRIAAVELQEPGRARAEVLVAMAGGPLAGPEDLLRTRADLMRFDLELTDEGGDDWKVVAASWRRARPEDFLTTP